MTRRNKTFAASGLTLLALVACDGSDGALGNPATQFGNQFLSAFNLSPVSPPQPTVALGVNFRGNDGPSLTEAPVDL